MVVRTLPDERYGSPALSGALCQLNAVQPLPAPQASGYQPPNV